MPRARIYGYLAVIFSLALGAAFFYCAGIEQMLQGAAIPVLSSNAYYAIAVPIGIVVLGVLGAGFWIGWTILTIKVAPPMPEIVEKKDYAKVKAFFLCLVTLAIAGLFVYGLILKSYWALAVPAAAVTLVLLGMVFWVGIAIITTRSTLPRVKGN
ncbi:MAG TPA: hypothetical protein PK544_18390 [Spirochaetota bacterium]|nr:hypothetical protein [Spirochaetota bacterium]HPQ54981.1 hypothetical protein [Spirochaetota bacterium]